MPFRFKKSESPAKSVRRVCRERIGAARERLREGGRSAAIHDVRREIKKLRAIFRLARDGAGYGNYRKGVKALREAAGYLAAPRDARVMLKAFEKLTGRRAAVCGNRKGCCANIASGQPAGSRRRILSRSLTGSCEKLTGAWAI